MVKHRLDKDFYSKPAVGWDEMLLNVDQISATSAPNILMNIP